MVKERPERFQCSVCFGDGEFCISQSCGEHFYCATCVRLSLEAILDTGQYPAMVRLTFLSSFVCLFCLSVSLSNHFLSFHSFAFSFFLFLCLFFLSFPLSFHSFHSFSLVFPFFSFAFPFVFLCLFFLYSVPTMPSKRLDGRRGTRKDTGYRRQRQR